ncbi:aldo/keto reductase [Nostoc ellipsosporum NOK]|uniref:aldo/keto reductase n=1 Tax=Sphingomonas sp. IBVSS2 TaxID=1985172 RepID=UPI000A2D4FFB|nr:aldo/keto reductase [Sphingomonas sp. IBVSS2]MDF2384374.1 aldo/keto reductase [Nostoc ellipsosporum NOK]OSZ68493.1 hypothetical protein CAP40_07885 [Sphingomonas sp. IBVSS2]
MKLALGTVQFGLDYGVTGNGQVSAGEVHRILAEARASGIDTLDTAIAYGTSETVLGAVGVADWNIITKLPPGLSANEDPAAWMSGELAKSFSRLGVERVEGLLLHRPEQLLEANGPALATAMTQARASGLVGQIGVSIYSPDELDRIWPILRPDIVQCPYSLFDRRIETSGWLARLADAGTQVHARSLFLQGLLLAGADTLPAYFARWRPLFVRLRQWTAEQGISQLAACLRFVLGNPAIARGVVGVETATQLREIVEAAEGDLPPLPANLATDDLDLLLPGRWT